MEIIPGRGVAAVQLGQRRADVEAVIGAPLHGPGADKAVYDTVPSLVVSYHPDDTVELVELAYSGDGREEVTFEGVQLTYRVMEDVLRDLVTRGYTCTPSDIGYEFHAGFAVFSMASLQPFDLDPGAWEEDDRLVVEGVSVAPYAYFTS